MRFNPKARLDTSRVSDRGGSGRGGSSMRLPIPGGAKAGGGLGVIIMILAMAAINIFGNEDGNGGEGGSPLDSLLGGTTGTDASRMADTARYEKCDTGEAANEDLDCARVAVENSLYAYWSDTMSTAGKSFRPATLSTFSGFVDTRCGGATSQMGPFYCPADQGIYLDSTFFSDVLEKQLGGNGGDFVEPYVLAHEYGHHVQNLLGTMSKVRTQKGPTSDAVRLELQADCYAGMWTRAAEGVGDMDGVSIIVDLDQGDIDEALDSAKAVGDDRIQQRGGGRIDREGWTHGSSEQRMRWFKVGHDTGDLAACDTFAARTL